MNNLKLKKKIKLNLRKSVKLYETLMWDKMNPDYKCKLCRLFKAEKLKMNEILFYLYLRLGTFDIFSIR